jgi:alkylation response protein AidB-like acyl-CoA dehydrogenase
MNYDARQQKVVDKAKEYADTHIRPRAVEFDEKGLLLRDLINKLADHGYLSASLSEKYGGLELDPIYYGHFTEAIGKACCSTRALITVQTSLLGETIQRWGTEKQKGRWLPTMARADKIGAFALTEPDVGTDARSVNTKYKKTSRGYYINGHKKWISFGQIADFFLVIASCDAQISSFILDRHLKGVKIIPIKGMLASRASHIAEIKLENVEVPQDNILGREGTAFDYIVTTALDHGRYSIAWAGVAVAQEALEEMVTYSRKRTQFNKKLHEFQLIRGMIADAATRTSAARAVCLNAGQMRKERHQDAIVETLIAKYFASQVANAVARDALQVHGARGCSNIYPVERLFRESKLLEIIEGTSQIHQEIIAKYALRKY